MGPRFRGDDKWVFRFDADDEMLGEYISSLSQGAARSYPHSSRCAGDPTDADPRRLPARVPRERAKMSPAIVSGGHVFFTGVTDSDAEGRMPADPEAQFRAAFEKIGLVLREAGLGFGALVEMTSYHVGLRQHFALFDTVRLEYVVAPYPAWTAVRWRGCGGKGRWSRSKWWRRPAQKINRVAKSRSDHDFACRLDGRAYAAPLDSRTSRRDAGSGGDARTAPPKKAGGHPCHGRGRLRASHGGG
jgi:enamine deaminase RidA (YjgF/YER057c/UK114 family)